MAPSSHLGGATSLTIHDFNPLRPCMGIFPFLPNDSWAYPPQDRDPFLVLHNFVSVHFMQYSSGSATHLTRNKQNDLQ